jgi:predicted nucleotidyltransferase/DNA-binding XRE family transcriptional regulator
MDNLGVTIRKLREERGLPLRTVAAYLDIDQAILSKIERGQRNANREQVVKLAGFFKVNERDLLVSWLSDKLVCEVTDDDLALKALQVAEEKVRYMTFSKTDRQTIIDTVKQELKKFSSIRKAWVFGSFARGEENLESDIDIALETDTGFSYFDMAEVQYVLQNSTKRKIDVGFIDTFRDHIKEHIQTDLKLIYER